MTLYKGRETFYINASEYQSTSDSEDLTDSNFPPLPSSEDLLGYKHNCVSDELILRLAKSEDERKRASALLNRMYAWRGYGNCHEIPNRDTHSTFVALIEDDIVGTVTLGVDSEDGLAADTIFKDEIDCFRKVRGATVCELTKLAFDTQMPSRDLLASLFHVVFIYGQHKHDCTDLFIEVNPRHRRFYKMMLGFEPIGDLKSNSSVNAPSQLMWLPVSNIAAKIAEYAGRGSNTQTRSLYPLFLSRSDQLSIHSRIANVELDSPEMRCVNLDLYQMKYPAAANTNLAA